MPNIPLVIALGLVIWAQPRRAARQKSLRMIPALVVAAGRSSAVRSKSLLMFKCISVVFPALVETASNRVFAGTHKKQECGALVEESAS